MKNNVVEIVSEKDGYIIALKPTGVLSEGAGPCMTEILGEMTGGEVFCVHRLDRAVSGLMAFALNKETAADLSRQMTDGSFEKEYLAVVHGELPQFGKMEDYLFKDSRTNKSFVVKKERKGVRKAHLSYETLEVKNGLSLVKIRLGTGRSHQIRVQFSSRKMPLFGDGKYGASDNCDIALFSHRISFVSKDGEKMTFIAYPEKKKPWDMFTLPSETENQ